MYSTYIVKRSSFTTFCWNETLALDNSHEKKRKTQKCFRTLLGHKNREKEHTESSLMNKMPYVQLRKSPSLHHTAWGLNKKSQLVACAPLGGSLPREIDLAANFCSARERTGRKGKGAFSLSCKYKYHQHLFPSCSLNTSKVFSVCVCVGVCSCEQISEFIICCGSRYSSYSNDGVTGS